MSGTKHDNKDPATDIQEKKKKVRDMTMLEGGNENDSRPSFMQQLFIYLQERFKVVTEMRL